MSKIFLASLLFSALLFPSTVSAQVVINEVLPNPTGDEAQKEWVELFNTTDQEIDLTGYVLKDAANHKLIIDENYVDDSTTIPANNWLVILRNGHPSFSLNNSGQETIDLYNPDETVHLDTFLYNDSEEDESWGRIPDAGLVHTESLDPTPGGSNQPPPAPTSSPTSSPEPTSTSTPTPTSEPTATPTNSPTPKPTVKAVKTTKTPTPTMEVEGEGGEDGVLLGLRDEILPTPTPEPESEKRGKFPLLAGLFITLGLGFIGAAGYPLLRDWKKRYNIKDGERKEKPEFNA